MINAFSCFRLTRISVCQKKKFGSMAVAKPIHVLISVRETGAQFTHPLIRRSFMTRFQINTPVFLLSICAVVLVFAVTSTRVNAQTKPDKFRQLIEDQYTLTNPCTGELMAVTDRWQFIVLDLVDKDGCDRYRVHANDMGSKAVSESGAKYQYPYVQKVVGDGRAFCDGCTYDYTATVKQKFVGQGKAPNFTFTYTLHMIANFCTNEFTILYENQVATCDNEPL